MSYDVEDRSILAQYVGRRFPLMISCVSAAILFYYLGASEIAATLIGAAVLIIKDYVDDIHAEG